MKDLYDQQRDLAQSLANQIALLQPNEHALVRLGGGVGTGRTTTLAMTPEPIRAKGLVPIVLPNEQSEFDTGASILARFADQVPASFLSDLDLSLLSSAKTLWQSKFSHVSEFINRHADEFVLLCDEPHYWSRLERTAQDVEGSDAIRFSDWLFREAKCRRIVTGDIPSGLAYIKTHSPKFELKPIELLRNTHSWGTASSIAESISKSSIGGIDYKSVMEVRLSVAIAWLISPEVAVRALQLSSSASSLLTSFLDNLEASAGGNERYQLICNALSRMTIGRCRWTDNLLQSLCPKLSELDRGVLVNSLCEEWDDGFNLHPLVRYEILSRAADRSSLDRRSLWRLRPDEHVAVHTQLFKLVESTNSGESLADDLEYLTHWSLSADRTITPDNNRIHFVEQLHEIGYALSYRHRQHYKAVEVYRLALGFDDTNARSHHYLAFNLDWNAEEQDRVEFHYSKAIEYNPQHPWYHSRWISYLVTRGRNKESRQAFRSANELIPISGNSPQYVFMGLHRWIARWMLHWGELAMAKDVLDSIPSEHRSEKSIQRLYDLLAALRMAEEGIAVFPLSVPKSRWWQPLGHTGLPIELNGKLLNWYPARINDIAGGVAYLSVGKPVSSARFGLFIEQRELALAEIAKVAMDFNVEELAEGRYLELGYHGDMQLTNVGLHQSLQLDDPELLPLVPPPNRWYEKARIAAWQQLASDQS